MDIPKGYEIVSQPKQAPTKPSIPQGYEAVSAPVFSSEQERAQAISNLPELKGILAGEDAVQAAKISPALLTATDPYEMGQILAANFPNVGVAQTPEGEFIAVNNETGAVASLNKPGLSMVDVVQGLGLVSAFFPSGTISQIPTSLGKRILLGGATSAATQGAIEAGQAAVGGEVSPTEVALAGGFGGAGELVAPGMVAAKNLIKGAPDVVPEAQLAREAASQIEKATGRKVGLFPAQAAEDADMLIKQRFIMQQPETSKMAADALRKQNKEAYDATSSLIDSLANEGALETGTARLYTASKDAMKAAKKKVTDVTTPMYNKAFGLNPDITGVKNNVLGYVDDIIEAYPDGDIKNNILAIKRSIQSAKNLKQLQGAKFQIDEKLKPVSGQQTSIGSVSRGEIKGIKDKLMTEMSDISPEFIAANDEYARLMAQHVAPLESSAVGKISAMPEDKLKSVTSALFDPKEVNPSVIRNARKVISDIDPQAWDEILRVEAQKRIGGLSELIEETGEGVVNRPAQIKRALYGNPEKRRVFLAAMNPTQRNNFIALETILTKASTGRAQGSPTALYQQLKEWLKGAKVRGVKAAASPISTIVGATEEAIFNQNLKTLSKAMLDPDYAGDFARAYANAKTSAGVKSFMQLLDNAALNIDTEQSEQDNATN